MCEMYYSNLDVEKKFPMCEDCRVGGNLKWDGIYPNIKFEKYACRHTSCLYYEEPPKKKERYNFTCINPRLNKIPFNVENINYAIKWAENWFCSTKYSKYFWWFESGKNPDNPSLHLHFIWAKSEHLNTQNHKRSICSSWNRIPFKGETKMIEVASDWDQEIRPGQIVKPDDYDSSPFTEEYLDDKLIYAINSSKDSHENFRDLISDPHEGQLRAWGGCKSLTAKFRDLQSI